MGAKDVLPTIVDNDPQTYENKHVHAVYDEIAPHFSSTRYKPWPIISAFMSNLPNGSIGLDSGTGNGKYLPLPKDRPGSVWTIGLDRSRNLLQFAQCASGPGIIHDVVLGDVLAPCWRPGCFDFAISIATIHHLSSEARRKLAVKRLLESVSPKWGRVLIYVWAIEQDEKSKRTIPVDHDATTGQDVIVPWVLSGEPGLQAGPQEPQVFKRYYHMFAKGELLELVAKGAAELGLDIGSQPGKGESNQGIEVKQSGWERSNYYVELQRWSN